MTILRRMMFATLTVALLASGGARAASTTNFSDQWWIEAESGWGAAVLQQSNTLFIDLMVYGTDGKPTWFVAAAWLRTSSPEGHTVFLGDLYATTGPYYGGAFNTALVSERKVGTLTFDATTGNSATIAYTVDGVPVSKNVVRQTWANDNLTGVYAGAWNYDCLGSPGAVQWWWFTLTINHNPDNSITILQEDAPPPPFGYFLYRGTYSQNGRMGQVVAELQPTDHGTMTFFEIEKSAAGFVGRFSGTMNDCQVGNGRIAAALK
jgi:hypothetical protein